MHHLQVIKVTTKPVTCVAIAFNLCMYGLSISNTHFKVKNNSESLFYDAALPFSTFQNANILKEPI